MKTSYAPYIFESLNGIVTIYKPLRISTRNVISEIRERFTEILNKYEPRPLDRRYEVAGCYNSNKQLIEVPNWADHPLVVGPRYVPWELPILVPYTLNIGIRTSGVVPLLIGKEAIKQYTTAMIAAKFINIYDIKATFGFATSNHYDDGNIIDKSTYKYIKSYHLDRILEKIVSTQRNRVFDSAYVRLNSQEAFKLAKSWPTRPPVMAKWPIIYSLERVEFNLPEFTIRVAAFNENEGLLAHLINDIGSLLKSSACVRSIRRVKAGPFSYEHSLADNDWNIQSFIENMQQNKSHLEDLRPSSYSDIKEISFNNKISNYY